MNCPRCGAEFALTDVFTGGRHASVAACPRCEGQWMRDTDLARLSEVVEPVLVEWRTLGSSGVQQQPLACPECEDAPVLRKLTSERDARVVIDTCDRCGGVWLDQNELRAIQQESLFALLSGLRQTPRT